MHTAKTLKNYIDELLANPNNTLINKCESAIKKAFDETVIGTSRIGYLTYFSKKSPTSFY